jgi:hypothetical protein
MTYEEQIEKLEFERKGIRNLGSYYYKKRRQKIPEEIKELRLKLEGYKLAQKEILEKINKCKEYEDVTKQMDRDGASPVISKEELLSQFSPLTKEEEK